MLLIHCPYCDKTLPELEFTYAGEAHIDRPQDPASLSDDEWRDFLFVRSNQRGVHFERWRHLHGCARFFNAARDTVSDKFLITYKAGEPQPELSALIAGPGDGSGKAQGQGSEKYRGSNARDSAS